MWKIFSVPCGSALYKFQCNIILNIINILHIFNIFRGGGSRICQLMFHTKCTLFETRPHRICVLVWHSTCEPKRTLLYRQGWWFKGENECSFGRDTRPMKGWVAGLAWFSYKASIIVLWQRQLITKVILTGLFSPFSLASEAHQSSRARMTYIVIKTTPCGHQKTNVQGISEDRNVYRGAPQ
jgi:hypothetical protein